MTDQALCPRCQLRPQAVTRNGRRRGYCSDCWRSLLRLEHEDGAERLNSRGQAEVWHAGSERWVLKSRFLAASAGVELDPDTRTRVRDGRVQVAVWHDVGSPGVAPLAGTARPPAADAPAPRRRRRPPCTQVSWLEADYGELLAAAQADGVTLAEWVRACALDRLEAQS